MYNYKKRFKELEKELKETFATKTEKILYVYVHIKNYAEFVACTAPYAKILVHQRTMMGYEDIFKLATILPVQIKMGYDYICAAYTVKCKADILTVFNEVVVACNTYQNYSNEVTEDLTFGPDNEIKTTIAMTLGSVSISAKEDSEIAFLSPEFKRAKTMAGLGLSKGIKKIVMSDAVYRNLHVKLEEISPRAKTWFYPSPNHDCYSCNVVAKNKF